MVVILNITPWLQAANASASSVANNCNLSHLSVAKRKADTKTQDEKTQHVLKQRFTQDVTATSPNSSCLSNFWMALINTGSQLSCPCRRLRWHSPQVEWSVGAENEAERGRKN
jgi:hypothetical protein